MLKKPHFAKASLGARKNIKNKLVVFLLTILVILVFIKNYDIKITPKGSVSTSNSKSVEILSVIPETTILPINWSDLGQRMIDDGVINEDKFRSLFPEGLSSEQEKIFTGDSDNLVLTEENSRFILNMLWAFGLANKNQILEEGEMSDEKYGGAGNFASTGGWTLSEGDSMNHYSNYNYINLSKDQQNLVSEVSKNIFRPCCGNSTHFPDCNHGMAMLGLLELMAANDIGESEMYKTALQVNSIWFPQTYNDLAIYFKEQGQDWSEVDAKLALSADYSSGQGYAATRLKIKSLPKPSRGGGSCGV